MIAVVQRISRGNVLVNDDTVAESGIGFLVLLGVAEGDTDRDAVLLSDKIAKLRVFSDENGKMNRNLSAVGGSVIVVSNFTLLANYRHGNRPDFLSAASPEEAERLYLLFIENLKKTVPNVSSGVFGADMKISICNDGPVTIVMDSKLLKA